MHKVRFYIRRKCCDDFGNDDGHDEFMMVLKTMPISLIMMMMLIILVTLVVMVMMVKKMLTNRKAEGRRPRVFTEQERMQKLLISKWNMKVFCLHCISILS